jgi:hypothetical protein
VVTVELVVQEVSQVVLAVRVEMVQLVGKEV